MGWLAALRYQGKMKSPCGPPYQAQVVCIVKAQGESG